MNRGSYRRFAKQRRIDNRRNYNETERSLEEEDKITEENKQREIKSVMETYKRGVEYPKEIQEVADFWRSLYYHFGTEGEEITKDDEGNSAVQEQIVYELYELSDDDELTQLTQPTSTSDGNMDIASRNGSFSFGNLKKEYQVLVFESYYGYKKGKCISKYESKTMLDSMLKAKLIKTPREKQADQKQKEKKKALGSKVVCWHCEADQKILSVDELFQCTNCQESLWVGEGGFEKVGDVYQ